MGLWSLDSIQLTALAVFLALPAIRPLLTRGGIPVRSAVAVAACKTFAAAIVAAFLLHPFSGWFSHMLGAVIGIASLLGIFGGLAILMFVGFGGTERYVSEWHVIKWTALGAAMFLVGVTITHHPFEVAKGIIVVQDTSHDSDY